MSSGTNIDVTFLPRWRDGLATTMALLREQPLRLLLFTAIPLFGVVFACAQLVRHIPLDAGSIGVILTFLALPFFMVATGVWQGQRDARKLGDQHYRFDGQGFDVRAGGAELRQPWQNIIRVRVRYGVLLLYFTRHVVHFIPLRALGVGEAEKIMAMARAGGVPRVDG